jgi:hypothetical protein
MNREIVIIKALLICDKLFITIPPLIVDVKKNPYCQDFLTFSLPTLIKIYKAVDLIFL